MSLERLLGKIGDDARLEGKKIVAEAKEEVARIKQKGDEDARRVAETIVASYHERAERERTRIMSEALAEGRTAFLSTQDELYKDVLAEVMRDAMDMPEERYRAWLKRTITDNALSGDEGILSSPHDRRLLEEGLLDEVNLALRDRGLKGSMSLVEGEAEFERGVILKGEKVENNLSLRTILRDTRDRHEEELLRILFGEVDVREVTRSESG
jgi:vacuolar-type H+-ATPase subunit E/Vma4